MTASVVAEATEVTRVIPHRFPVLLVDQVTEMVVGRTLSARKAVSANEPCYRHFGPDQPASELDYPSMLLVESWGQAAVLLAAWDHPTSDVRSGRIDLAGAIERVRFLRPVRPGSVLEHRVRMVRAVGDTAILAGETLVDGETVLEIGHFVVALRPVAELTPAVVASPRTDEGTPT
ncbi:3-hydroxyacyl-ACP dehydratase FabZ family protein [Micromonospora sp. WMMA1947]|uniref:3-hydroxyacyl-ACP dehydratase FabZ family protein n=1 Tax=Micromonospora sp. WMMA1947 TaxID=3015163 RepID=UPI00248A97ED|nr:3-hydroxyacyl-ACP dehydratase FabZ family protein [Micromonospora sp. WMMA1947]WBC07497.1 beta-hydroxyacyl-ACP dehydratase [Micromonospora sp. WMMA1947]